MVNSADITKKLKKSYGDSVVTRGDVQYGDTPRIPSGIFPFDVMSGGGFPMGRVSVVYGPESSGKTNLVLRTIAEGQRLYPDKVAVFVDAESSFDPDWASLLGVDTSKLIVVHPEYAEQAIDIMESFLYATDVFVVVLDSIASMTTQNEVESSAEKMIVGGSSLLIGKLFKKTMVSYNRLRNQGIIPAALIGINQVRTKIGVLYGDPETMPGGYAVKFSSSFTVRLYGKSVIDKKINPVLPAFKETSAIMKKWRVPILAMRSEYNMQMLVFGGNNPGHCDDWSVLSGYMKDLGYLAKGDKTGWMMFGKPYKTLEEARTYLYSEPGILGKAKNIVVSDLLSRGGIPQSEELEGEVDDGA